jgi:hypothetical protein
MREIKPNITKEIEKHTNNLSVGKALPFPITNYRQLVEHIANLSFLNKDYLLFYRGQSRDYTNKAGDSTFYPSIYREENLKQNEIQYRFEILDQAAKELKRLFIKQKIEGYSDLSRKKYIQWSILQHYEVCKTPLLDFTHSLAVACSFAQLDNNESNGYVYAFALPYITNRISINSEHDIVNIRLLSICPPDALRPFFQEGYLAGTTDITDDYDSKNELDFNSRLIAKFEIPNNKVFWGNGVNRISKTMLYPKNDRIESLCKNLEIQLVKSIYPGDLGTFVTEWSKIERKLREEASQRSSRLSNLSQNIEILENYNILDRITANKINDLRRFRNTVIHKPESVSNQELQQYLIFIDEILKNLGIKNKFQ